MEQWWNDTDRGKPQYWGKNLSQCHTVHHKSYIDWPRCEGGKILIGDELVGLWKDVIVVIWKGICLEELSKNKRSVSRGGRTSEQLGLCSPWNSKDPLLSLRASCPYSRSRAAMAHWRLKYNCNMIGDVTQIDALYLWRHKKLYQLEVLTCISIHNFALSLMVLEHFTAQWSLYVSPF